MTPLAHSDDQLRDLHRSTAPIDYSQRISFLEEVVRSWG